MLNNCVQQKILEYISDYEKENGYPPTIRELCSASGVRSTSSMYSYLKELRKSGKIEMSQGRSRTIKVFNREEAIERPVGRWICTVKECFDDLYDDGEMMVYATASCCFCNKLYHNGTNIYYNYTNFYTDHDETEIIPESVKNELREKAKTEIKRTRCGLPRYCEHCGAELSEIVVASEVHS